VTRRPRSRLPPKLPDPAREREPSSPRPPSVAQRLKAAQVTGRSTQFGRDEILAVMRRVVRGDPRALLGCARFDGLTSLHVHEAVERVYGWDGTGTRAAITGQRTVEAFGAAITRTLEVAAGGGRIAFATSAPASLFVVHRSLAEAAVRVGGRVFDAVESAPLVDRGPGALRLRWIDRVAMTSDSRALLDGRAASDHAAEELLFTAGPLDLVVADRTFAGRALASGLEVVAFAGLDALALAVAEWRGMAVRVVPLDESRPPASYAPLVELLASRG
jgi:hypothetical protein